VFAPVLKSYRRSDPFPPLHSYGPYPEEGGAMPSLILFEVVESDSDKSDERGVDQSSALCYFPSLRRLAQSLLLSSASASASQRPDESLQRRHRGVRRQ
jgi:hypothetical protein